MQQHLNSQSEAGVNSTKVYQVKKKKKKEGKYFIFSHEKIILFVSCDIILILWF